jgi:hypothetical protein
VLDDLIKRGLRRPEFLIVDGAAGLDQAIAAVWDGVPVQPCTVLKHRNLLAHAPELLHEEIAADYTDMIYAATPEETRYSPSPACRRANGKAPGQRMRWTSVFLGRARFAETSCKFVLWFDRAAGVLLSRPPLSQRPRAGAVKPGRVLRGHRKAWS